MNKVFPLTYLNSVSISVSFPEMDQDCYEDLDQFFSSHFGLELSVDRLSILNTRPISFNNEEDSVRWTLKIDSIEVTLSHRAYKCYAESLLPMIQIIESFLNSVGRNFNSITLNKVNIIPVDLKSYDELGENAISIFSEKVLSNWNNTYFFKDATTLLYLIKSNSEDVGIETICGFISKEGVPENQPARYILDLTAVYDIDVHNEVISGSNNLPLVTGQMNDKLYIAFTEGVSKDVLKSMEG